jgi:hypothetical protein
MRAEEPRRPRPVLERADIEPLSGERAPGHISHPGAGRVDIPRARRRHDPDQAGVALGEGRPADDLPSRDRRRREESAASNEQPPVSVSFVVLQPPDLASVGERTQADGVGAVANEQVAVGPEAVVGYAEAGGRLGAQHDGLAAATTAQDGLVEVALDEPLVPERLADAVHHHGQRRLRDEGLRPDRVPDLGAGERPWPAHQQQGQELVGLRLEGHRLARAKELAPLLVELEVSKPEGHGPVRAGGKQTLTPSKSFVKVERPT